MTAVTYNVNITRGLLVNNDSFLFLVITPPAADLRFLWVLMKRAEKKTPPRFLGGKDPFRIFIPPKKFWYTSNKP